MDMDTALHQNYEETLVKIARGLPPERVEQLVDFARFLEAQLLGEGLFDDEDSAEVAAENAAWDGLLASEESQALLEKMAQEALADYRAGKSNPIAFDDDGRLVPG